MHGVVDSSRVFKAWSFQIRPTAIWISFQPVPRQYAVRVIQADVCPDYLPYSFARPVASVGFQGISFRETLLGESQIRITLLQ